jgi:hypothetical protein
MHTKMSRAERVSALERILDALAEDLVESTDEELLQAARDLGMDPTMRGSAAFIGIKSPTAWQLSQFFEISVRPALLPGARERRRKPRNRGRKPDA